LSLAGAISLCFPIWVVRTLAAASTKESMKSDLPARKKSIVISLIELKERRKLSSFQEENQQELFLKKELS
jgi:hypothetical protein